MPAVREWIGALVELPSFVQDGDPPYRPIAHVWVDPTTQYVYGAELSHPRDALADAPKILEALMRKHARFAPVSGVRVASQELRESLRGQVSGVDVVCAPTPELTSVIQSLTAAMASRAGNASRERFGPDVGHELATRFDQVAAGLWETAPWEVTPSDSYLGVQCEALGITAGALCIVGQMRESFGFSLFFTEDDARAHRDACELTDVGTGAVSIPRHITVSFDAEARKKVRGSRHRSRRGPKVTATAVLLDTDFTARPLGRDELRGVVAVMVSLGIFAQDPHYEAAWVLEDEVFTWKGTIDADVDAMIDVTLEVPLWLDDREPMAESDHEQRAAHEDEAAALLARFARTGGESGETLMWAEMLLMTSIDAFACRLFELDPIELEELLFEVVPAGVYCKDSDAPAIIDALRKLLAFIAASDPTIASHARKLLDLVPRQTAKKLARRLAEPSLWSPAKQLMHLGTQAGFDMKSADGINAFMNAMSSKQMPPAKVAASATQPKHKRTHSAKQASSKSNRKR